MIAAHNGQHAIFWIKDQQAGRIVGRGTVHIVCAADGGRWQDFRLRWQRAVRPWHGHFHVAHQGVEDIALDDDARRIIDPAHLAVGALHQQPSAAFVTANNGQHAVVRIKDQQAGRIVGGGAVHVICAADGGNRRAAVNLRRGQRRIADIALHGNAFGAGYPAGLSILAQDNQPAARFVTTGDQHQRFVGAQHRHRGRMAVRLAAHVLVAGNRRHRQPALRFDHRYSTQHQYDQHQQSP